MFHLEYTIVADNSYKITLAPKMYIFMYNLGVKVTVMGMPDPNFKAANARPFHSSVFDQTRNLTWSLIKAPANGET